MKYQKEFSRIYHTMLYYICIQFQFMIATYDFSENNPVVQPGHIY